MKTRAKKTGTTKRTSEPAQEANPPVSSLKSSEANPPKTFVLPTNVSSDARIVSLSVSSGAESSEHRRYLVCPWKGFFEFTKVAAPKRACRSWLLTPGKTSDETRTATNADVCVEETADAEHEQVQEEAYVLQSPDLFIATPVDPLFFLLGSRDVLWPNSSMGSLEYLSIDTRLGILRSNCEHLDFMMRDCTHSSLEQRLIERIKDVCSVESIPGAEMEPTYCLSMTKLFAELVKMADRAVQQGLPKSMEHHFVQEALRVPEPIIPRESSNLSAFSDSTIGDIESDTVSFAVSQNTQTSTNMSTTVSTNPIVIPSPLSRVPATSDVSSEKIEYLLRIRTVIDYITASYLPIDLRQSLEAARAKIPLGQSSIDFTPLDDHLARIARLKAERQALRSLSDNISRKRSAVDEEESMEKAEIKKRKKEEEELRKKNMSRGVQQLAKADTTGMKKLSAFFAKKAPIKK